jgi:Flp pilus assembly protein TadD
MTPTVEPPSQPQKPNFWQRLVFRYRWLSLRNKIALWAALCAIVIGIFSLQYVRPTYRAMKMRLYIHMAEDLAKKKDYNAASLALRKAILSGMEYPDSWKALAKFLEEVKSPDVIDVWARLATMEPEVHDYRYKQVAAALAFGRGYQAAEILAQIPADWHGEAGYLRQEAALAISRKNAFLAERDLQQLLKLDPGDAKAAFDLAALRAASSDDAPRAAGREDLRKIADQRGEFAADALRQLVSLSVQDRDLDEADRIAARLVALPDITLRDRLLHLQLELATKSWSASATLQNVRDYLESHPADFNAAMEWMLNAKLDPDGTRRWVDSLPTEFVRNPDVQTGLLEFYLNTSNLEQAFRILRARQNEFQLSPNVIDLAEQALKQNADDDSDCEQTWMRVIYATEGNPRALQFLSLLASTQNWTSATGRALSALADAAPMQPAVWNLLIQHERAVGNLPGLWKALGGLLKVNPYDKNIGSEWVIASILLRKGNSREALRVAEHAYQSASPADASVCMAYAMELVENNRPQEALAIIDKMSLTDRREPSRALYIGAILTANKHNAEALDYFTRAESFDDFHFAEEKAMLRIWKGVAMGEATTAQEAEKELAARKDYDAEAEKIRKDLEQQLRSHNDPAEAQRIFQSLKSEMENRPTTITPEVREILEQARKEEAKTPPLTP